jgi:ABC-type dipeptide/oligopeptide/nickel transport system permease subunit
VTVAAEPNVVARRTRGRMPRMRALVHRRSAVVAALLFAAVVGYCVFWPMLSAYGPDDVDLARSAQGPSGAHPLGTDQLGRDLLVRLAVGGQNSLLISGIALAIILLVGIVYGTTAAMAARNVDAAMMRIVDGLFAVPRILVAIAVLVALKLSAQNIQTIAFALSIVGWMLTARLVRGQVLSLKVRDYVTAARAVGASRIQIAARHLIPNAAGVILVAILLEVPTVIIGEASLAVLGLGPEPPTATWGNVAQLGLEYSRVWDMFVATAMIVVFALSANVLVDAVHDALDPRRDTA